MRWEDAQNDSAPCSSTSCSNCWCLPVSKKDKRLGASEKNLILFYLAAAWLLTLATFFLLVALTEQRASNKEKEKK